MQAEAVATIAEALENLPPTHRRLLRLAMAPGQGNRAWQARVFQVSETSISVWRRAIIEELGAANWDDAVHKAFVSGHLIIECIELDRM